MTAGAHPGPASVVLPGAIAGAILGQAIAERPNEACGLILGSAPVADGGRPVRYVACRNVHPEPATRFEIDPLDVLAVDRAAEPAGEVVWGIVHSHVTSPAVPSGVDVGFATWWPDALHVLATLVDQPSLRAWRIIDGERHEVGLAIA